MSKEKIVIKSIGGVGINETGSCLVLMFTNYGVLMYDSGTEKFSLNDIEISSLLSTLNLNSVSLSSLISGFSWLSE